MGNIHILESPHVRTLTMASIADGVVRIRIAVDMPYELQRIKPALLSLYADMLMRGTATLSREALTKKLDSIGALLSISADDGGLAISLTATTEHHHAALRLLKEVLNRPQFSKTELIKAKKQFAQAFHEAEDDARAQASIGFARALYSKDHPYYAPSSKELSRSVTALTQKHVRALHAHLHRASWTVGISSPRSLHAPISKFILGIHKRGTLSTKRVAVIAPSPTETRVFKTIHGKTNIEIFIGHTLPFTGNSREYLAFSLGIDVLAKRGSFVGRLMSTVREKEGLTYGIYGWLVGATRVQAGHFNIWTFFTAKDFAKGIASTMREIELILTKGVTQKEVARMQELNRNQFDMLHGADSSALNFYHRAYHAGFTPAEARARAESLATLTQKEVNHVLRTYLNPRALTISGAGPIRADGVPLEKA